MAKIHVGIIDDHQSIIDGYTFRLQKDADIEVTATGNFGEDISRIFSGYQIDVLLLDISVPSSEENPNPYPILHTIPTLLGDHPDLSIIVISMHNRKTLINSIIEAGASGYILKDDRESLVNLAEIIKAVHHSGIYFSKRTFELLNMPGPGDELPELSKRQKQILTLCAANPDWSTKDIGRELGLAASTVRNTLSKTYLEVGVKSLRAAVDFARENHLITPYQ